MIKDQFLLSIRDALKEGGYHAVYYGDLPLTRMVSINNGRLMDLLIKAENDKLILIILWKTNEREDIELAIDLCNPLTDFIKIICEILNCNNRKAVEFVLRKYRESAPVH